MNGKRLLVHFDENSLDVFEYVNKQCNKSGFVRDCIKEHMNREEVLKNVIKESVRDIFDENRALLQCTPYPETMAQNGLARMSGGTCEAMDGGSQNFERGIRDSGVQVRHEESFRKISDELSELEDVFEDY